MSEKLKKLYCWSKGFQKFACYPLSARFLQNRTSKEIVRFVSRVNSEILAKVFVLYPHIAREEILWCLNDDVQMSILENMYQYVRSNEFSLTECVDTESIMQDMLKDFCPDKFLEYKEMENMEELIAGRLGKKEYRFSKDVSIRKVKQDIYLTMDVNLEEYHIHYDEPSWHSACYGRSLEAYLCFLYEYIQKQKGVVYLDVNYAHKIPDMTELFIEKYKNRLTAQEGIDETEYFLLIYRIRNLVRLFSWIKMSKKLECQIQQLEGLLKVKSFYSKITENNLISKNSFSERIKEVFSDNIAKRIFRFGYFVRMEDVEKHVFI